MFSTCGPLESAVKFYSGMTIALPWGSKLPIFVSFIVDVASVAIQRMRLEDTTDG